MSAIRVCDLDLQLFGFAQPLQRCAAGAIESWTTFGPQSSINMSRRGTLVELAPVLQAH